MFKLNHINLSTSDVPGLAAFFESCLNFKITERRGSNKFAVLEGEGPFYLHPDARQRRRQHQLPGDVSHRLRRSRRSCRARHASTHDRSRPRRTCTRTHPTRRRPNLRLLLPCARRHPRRGQHAHTHSPGTIKILPLSFFRHKSGSGTHGLAAGCAAPIFRSVRFAVDSIGLCSLSSITKAFPPSSSR